LKEIAVAEPHDIDGLLIQWGDRLFYPGNRIVNTKPQPKFSALAARQRASARLRFASVSKRLSCAARHR
jgi:hypothetical protein